MKKNLFTTLCTFAIALLGFMPALADGSADSGNVSYTGGFVPVSSDTQSGTTELYTGIFEYMVTFPKTTPMVPYYTKTKRIGKVTVNGEAFMKPYKIAVNVSKKDFKLVTKETRTVYKDDTIEFDVVQLVTDKFGDVSVGESLLGKTIYYYKDHYKDVVIKDDQSGKINLSNSGDTGSSYMNGGIANINQSLDVGIQIPKSEWATASPGKYKGKLTFYATVDNSDIWSSNQ